MKSYRERTEDILEKANTAKKARTARNKKLVAGISCSLAAVLILNLALFLPRGGNIAALPEGAVVVEPGPVGGVLTGETGHRAKSYSDVMRALGGLYPSGGSEWEGDVQGPATDSDHPGGSGSDAPGGSDKPSEYTDWEREGVIEGDLLARNEGRAFYLAKSSVGAIYAPYYRLQAYSLEETPELLGTLVIEPEEGFRFNSRAREIYLSEDGATVTVITDMFSGDPGAPSYVAIYTVDAEDPHTMSVTRTQFLSGGLLTSRMIDGDLFILSKYFPGEPGDEKDYIPQFGQWGAMTCIPAEDIFLPACVSSPAYTVFSVLSEKGEYLDGFAALTLADCICFTREACYMTGSHAKFFQMNCGPVSAEGVQTDLLRIPIAAGGKFGSPAMATFAGTVKDRYSMDCFRGTLRIAASVDGKYASLYILDAKTLTAVAAAENFAPEGETVFAVTFEQDRVYICTSDRKSDPVFCFDLSGLPRITYRQGEEHKGYSTELIAFTGDLFLGVGYDVGYEGATRRVKIELYDRDARLVASYLDPGNELYAGERKSFLVDGERGLFGLCTLMPYQPSFSLLSWDGSVLKRILRVDISEGGGESRALLLGDTLLLFDGTLIVRSLG